MSDQPLDWGTLSLSLNVKDLVASRDFYLKLGFEKHDGNEADNWLIMKHGDTHIGLFQGMFDDNLITFHPKDVRSLQKHIKAQGITLDLEVPDEDGSGAGHFSLKDPDGNLIYVEQF